MAVVDTGIDHDASRARGQPLGQSGRPANGLDDDGNGFTDDVHGIDLFDTRRRSRRRRRPRHPRRRHHRRRGQKRHRHRRESTGECTLMALKFLDATEPGNTATPRTAIDYAVRHGARVINASWGGPAFSSRSIRAIQRRGRPGASWSSRRRATTAPTRGLLARVPGRLRPPRLRGIFYSLNV